MKHASNNRETLHPDGMEDAVALRNRRKPTLDSRQLRIGHVDGKRDTSRYKELLRALDEEYTETVSSLQSQIEVLKKEAEQAKGLFWLDSPGFWLEDGGTPQQPIPSLAPTRFFQRGVSGGSEQITEGKVFESEVDSPKGDSANNAGEGDGLHCQVEDGGRAPIANAETTPAPDVVAGQDLALAMKPCETFVSSKPSSPKPASPRRLALLLSHDEEWHRSVTPGDDETSGGDEIIQTVSTQVNLGRNPTGSSDRIISNSSDWKSRSSAQWTSRPTFQRRSRTESPNAVDLSIAIAMINKRFRSHGERNNPVQTFLASIVRSQKFEATVMALIMMNSLVMAAELQYHGAEIAVEIGASPSNVAIDPLFPSVTAVLFGLEVFFTTCFAVELTMRVLEGGRAGAWRFLTTPLNWLDVSVVLVGALQIAAMCGKESLNPQIFRLVRVAKLFRGIRLVEFATVMSSFHLISKSLKASLSVMGWSLILLCIIQCIAAMVICQLVHIDIQGSDRSLENKLRVMDYYGTFTKSVITMFEVTFANWGPPCRVLMENLHEAYALFFLIYRCFVGFAILNVITAVFVQQTTRVAQADQEVMIVAKQKEKQAYLAKLKRFFEAVDTSGDGYISLEEFSDMMSRPEVELWLSSLDISITDAQMLFQLIDDGDNQISIDEFVFGISRLRGNARSVDVMEILMQLAKMEALMVDSGIAGGRRTPHKPFTPACDSSLVSECSGKGKRAGWKSPWRRKQTVELSCTGLLTPRSPRSGGFSSES